MTSQKLADASDLADLLFGLSEAVSPALAGKFYVPWDALEQKLFSVVAAVFRDFARRFTRVTDRLNAIEPHYWAAFQTDLYHVALPVINQAALFGVAHSMRGEGRIAGINLNWNLANAQAENWAATHAAELVKQVTDTTRQAVRDKVSKWITDGGSTYELADQISNIKDEKGGSPFGIARARLIAQTESTNAYAAGNIAGWAQTGYQLPAIQPAAHPNCRCRLQNLKLKDGSKVLVWHTVTDGRVCKQPIQTPWGVKQGCAGLDGLIVSAGVYGGLKPGDM